MNSWVFDIETDGLLAKCTKMWVLVAIHLETKKIHYWLEGDMSWKKVFDKADLIIGHNIINFDLCVLEKLFNYKLPKSCNVHDTLIMSQLLDYRRFGNNGHGLKVWGEALGFPKDEYSDWSKYTPEMLAYCIQDTKLTVRVYEELVDGFQELVDKAPQFAHYMRAEHFVAKWAAKASLHGWPFDLDAAKKLHLELKAKMQEAYNALSARLGTKVVAVDKEKGEVAPKKPKWLKNGFYDNHTAKWFDIDPCSGFEGEERMVMGEYCRIEFVPLSLDSVADVKTFLYRNDWIPTEWNFKVDPVTGKKVKSSPKVSEDSLEFLGGDGKLYTEFLTAKSRLGILNTWINSVDENGMLHGDSMTIGTPSMRTRHSIIVNVPAADSPWGKEMRSLFKCLPDWKLIVEARPHSHMGMTGPKRNVPCVSWWPLPSSQALSCR